MAREPSDEPASGADDDLDELFDRSKGRPDAPPSSRRRGKRGWAGRPVRGWKSSDERDDELEAPEDGERRPVLWRARDSLWFEPLVALAIIVVLLVSLFAYTSNWPPVYVVESNSMQHGAGDHLNALNAGDVVLAQRTSQGQIATYFGSLARGSPTNYGEFGDVILYYPNGNTAATPVIHRPLLYLVYFAQNQSYNVTGLSGLPCGPASSADYYTPGTPSGCGTTNLQNSLTLRHIGWKNLTLTITFSICRPELGNHSGFLTLGDNNSYADQVPASCGAGSPISSLVEPGWVIGVARGLLPWFGAIKLFLDGNAQLVPSASWEYLGLSVAGVLFVGAGLHFLLRRLGVRSATRRREEARRVRRTAFEEDDELGDRPSRAPVRSWKEEPPDDEADTKGRSRASFDDRRRAHGLSRSRPRRPHGPAGEAPTAEDATDEE